MAEAGNCTIADVSDLCHKYCCWKQETLLLRVLNDLLVSKHESADSLVICYQLFCQILIVNIFLLSFDLVQLNVLLSGVGYFGKICVLLCTAQPLKTVSGRREA